MSLSDFNHKVSSVYCDDRYEDLEDREGNKGTALAENRSNGQLLLKAKKQQMYTFKSHLYSVCPDRALPRHTYINIFILCC